LAKGRTAIDGLSESGNVVWRLSDAGFPDRTRYTRSGRGNILQLLLANVFKGDLELPRGVLLHTGRDAYAARFRHGLEARRDIHSIPKYVTVLSHDVTLVDADAKLDPAVLRSSGIPLGHTSLNFKATAERVDHAAELDQQTIAGGLDDAAAVLCDFGSRSSRRSAFSRPSVPSSSAPMRRLYPATSAARMAASLRSTRSVAKSGAP
jgi:hypothetical protein